MASFWMDKKPVTMLSTLAQADVTHTEQRNGTKSSVQCPDAVVLYNQVWIREINGDSTTVSALSVGRAINIYK